MATVKSADIKPSKLKDGGMFEIDYGDSKDTVKVHVLENRYLEFMRDAGKDSFNLTLTLDKGTMNLFDGMGNQYTCTNRNGALVIRRAREKGPIPSPSKKDPNNPYQPSPEKYQKFLQTVGNVNTKEHRPATPGDVKYGIGLGGSTFVKMVKYSEGLGDIEVQRKKTKTNRELIEGITRKK